MQETLSSQLPVFENFLDKAPKSGGYDAVRQCVVLLVGSLARHLAPDDARIKPITLRLVAALSTPSQQVTRPPQYFYSFAVTKTLSASSWASDNLTHTGKQRFACFFEAVVSLHFSQFISYFNRSLTLLFNSTGTRSSKQLPTSLSQFSSPRR